MKQYFVYIIGNKRPTLYIGVNNNLFRRINEHKNSLIPGFTKKYSLNKLLYYEVYEEIHDAIKREKQLKHWEREWKLDLIKKINPELKDLYNNLS